VCCTRGLFGRCLEIRSHNPTRTARWMWSPNLVLRLFMQEPEPLEAAIREQIKQEQASGREVS
jgi:hypothetical protein